jgi:hypothetical protein
MRYEVKLFMVALIATVVLTIAQLYGIDDGEDINVAASEEYTVGDNLHLSTNGINQYGYTTNLYDDSNVILVDGFKLYTYHGEYVVTNGLMMIIDEYPSITNIDLRWSTNEYYDGDMITGDGFKLYTENGEYVVTNGLIRTIEEL